MKVLEGKTITDIAGVKASGISSGIKKNGNKDLCIVYSENKAVAAAVFTTNKVKAAPLIVDMAHIRSENTQAIVVNSGNANACTGDEGLENAKQMTALTAAHLGLKPQEVLVSSTGVIGVALPMQIVEKGIKAACEALSETGGLDAATAIMTTDTRMKTITVETTVAGKPVMLSGMAKGSGMIHPNMATMLSYVITDVSIDKAVLQKVLEESVQDSYNMISVDGDTSTNDTVMVLANGAAGNATITGFGDDYLQFKEALDYVNMELAKMIIKDGEGATKLLECTVSNAAAKQDAKLLSKSVICSSLVKAAFFGNDANWGRILCAMGYSGAAFAADKVDIFFESEAGCIQLVQNGQPLNFCEETATNIMAQKLVKIKIDMKDGSAEATAWGCDLSYEYVKINGSYRS